MVLHATPEQHAADPPGAWQVSKVKDRIWHLDSSLGGTLGTFTTKREAEQAKTEGRLVALYDKEGRWFAGEPVPGWKPYVPQQAEAGGAR